MPILDAFGRPYPAQPPQRITADTSITGARPNTFASVARALTPARLGQVLRQAETGDIEAMLTLAEEMEERDPHYFSVLGTRKMAVTGLPQHIEPADESETAARIADEFRAHVMETPEFSGLLFDLLDALSKGFAAVQPVWDTSVRPWRYKQFYYTDPRWFTVDELDLHTFLLRTQSQPQGETIPKGRFVFHFPKIKSGLAIRGGLSRVVAIAIMSKFYTLKDWLAFMEVFGMPTRIGRYDPETMTQTEQDQILNALRTIGHDASALLPMGAEIELLDHKRSEGGDSLFGGLSNYLDEQISKAVVGQTMTADSGSSLSQAKVHQQVRQDILEHDSRQLEGTINAHILRPWVVYNYGENAPMPRWRLHTDPPEDVKSWTDAVIPWVRDGGLKVVPQDVYDKFSLTDPSEVDESVELLGAAAPEPAPNGATPGVEVAENAAVPERLAVPEERPGDLAREWEPVLGDQVDILEQTAANAESYEDFVARLETTGRQFDSSNFVRRLAFEMAKARGEANSA